MMQVLEKEKYYLTELNRGDHQAFEALYHLHKEGLVRHLLFLFKSGELAEEVAQDTFVTIWQERAKVDPNQSFKAYLYTIATNRVYNLFRRAAHDEALREKLNPLPHHHENLVEAYIRKKENEELIQSLLAQMPDRQREVFILAKLEGYSYQEISERLQISANTINTHLKRANQLLKKRFRERQDWYGFLLILLADSFN